MFFIIPIIKIWNAIHDSNQNFIFEFILFILKIFKVRKILQIYIQEGLQIS